MGVRGFWKGRRGRKPTPLGYNDLSPGYEPRKKLEEGQEGREKEPSQDSDLGNAPWDLKGGNIRKEDKLWWG